LTQLRRQTYSDVRGNTTSNSDTDLHSKLVLLTITFPRLRIIWSSSPYATSDIFEDLKINRDEPDAATAGSIGATEAGDRPGEEREATVNQTPQELLRSMPGVVSTKATWLRKVGYTSLITSFTVPRPPRITDTLCRKWIIWKS
jgi:DNA excision repair protein ERCC-4